MNFEKKFEQLLKLIGNTPLIKINYQFKGEKKYAYIKAEWYNLSGSIKDRVAYYILKNAYETGQIDEHTPICVLRRGGTDLPRRPLYRGHMSSLPEREGLWRPVREVWLDTISRRASKS